MTSFDGASSFFVIRECYHSVLLAAFTLAGELKLFGEQRILSIYKEASYLCRAIYGLVGHNG